MPPEVLPMKPGGQVPVQKIWPESPVKVPMAQGVHASGEVWETRGLAVPGAQAVQFGEAGEEEKEPKPQAVHAATEVARREGWKVPGGQLEQAR